jgi:hypothetical protein
MIAHSIRYLRPPGLFRILACLGAILLFVDPIACQIEDLFDSTSFVRGFKSRYRLNTKDLQLLRPLIKRQNESLLTALGNNLDANNSNYMSMWNDMRRLRSEFEDSFPGTLTSRQRIVLRAARAEAEKRLADEWLDSYMHFLEDSLELDLFQVNYIWRVFELEQAQRLRLLMHGNSEVKTTDSSWQSASAEREKRLQFILTPEQLSTYQRLNDPAGRFIT